MSADESTMTSEAGRAPAEKSTDGLLMPILATGVGRGGTTMLMQQLGRDPRCLFNRTYAFGTMWLSYFAKFAHMLLRENPDGHEPPVQVTNLNAPAFNTLHVPLRRTPEDLTIDRQRILLELWRTVSESSRAEHPGALFYAEKARVALTGVLRDLMPSYTVYQLRDPRDVFLSQLSFMKKSPGVTFGKHWSDSARALALSGRFLELIENYNHDRKDSSCLVRYEELVANPEDPLPELRKATGWMPSEPMPGEFHERHRSSKNAGDSIRRWQRETFPPAVMSDISMALGTTLESSGYESAGITVPQAPLRLDLSQNSDVARLGDVHDGAFLECEPGGARFAVSGSSFSLSLPLDGDTAGRVRQVWVCLTGGLDGTCSVFWRKSSQAFDAERCSEKPYAAGGHTSILRFPVSEHKAWVDNPSELRLSLFNRRQINAASGTCIIRWVMIV